MCSDACAAAHKGNWAIQLRRLSSLSRSRSCPDSGGDISLWIDYCQRKEWGVHLRITVTVLCTGYAVYCVLCIYGKRYETFAVVPQ